MFEKLKLKIVAAAETRCAPGWRWSNPGQGSPGFYNLWLVTKGAGTMRAGGMNFPLSAGDCFMLRRWRPNLGTHDPKNPLTVLWLDFLAKGDCDDAKMPKLHRRAPDLEFIAKLTAKAIETFVSGNQKEAADWLKAALRALAEEDKKARGTRSMTRRKLQLDEICAKIRARPERVDLDVLAKECGCSPDRFSKLFKAREGLPPRAFATRARMERAMGLLRMSDMSVGEIAEAAGYGDIFHFSHQFKLFWGVSPSASRSKPAQGGKPLKKRR